MKQSGHRRDALSDMLCYKLSNKHVNNGCIRSCCSPSWQILSLRPACAVLPWLQGVRLHIPSLQLQENDQHKSPAQCITLGGRVLRLQDQTHQTLTPQDQLLQKHVRASEVLKTRKANLRGYR